MKVRHNILSNIYLDTTADKKLTVQVGSTKLQRKLEHQQQASRNLLPLIQQAMKEEVVVFKDILGVATVAGPGPFTALRVGVATANTLALVLSVPVVGLRADQFDSFEDFVTKAARKLLQRVSGLPVRPYYGRPPNITKRKKKIIR
jgi:tRNA threonylcarbamoyl adenosine modification protein YeaZ